MPILRCSVNDCFYNKQDECTLEEINVSGEEATSSASTQCDSFIAKSTYGEMKNTVREDLMPQPVVSIGCKAEKCKYNDNFQCVADHIAVKREYADKQVNTSDDTQCATFKCSC